MKLSRTEANWIASKLLSDGELERERSAQLYTRWLTILFPALKQVRPTERVSVLRNARQRASREPLIMWPAVIALIVFLGIYLGIPRQSRPAWLNLLPGAVFVGYFVAQYCRTRALLRAVPKVSSSVAD